MPLSCLINQSLSVLLTSIFLYLFLACTTDILPHFTGYLPALYLQLNPLLPLIIQFKQLAHIIPLRELFNCNSNSFVHDSHSESHEYELNKFIWLKQFSSLSALHCYHNRFTWQWMAKWIKWIKWIQRRTNWKTSFAIAIFIFSQNFK